VGSNSDSLRRSNLSAILRLVHLRGSVRRAQLTAEVGLGRSTIGELVAELADRELLIEGDPVATARVGRPSPTIGVLDRVVALAVSVEFDAITVGVVALGARVIHHQRIAFDHPVAPDEFIETVRAVLTRLRKGPLARRRLVGIGVAVPGFVRAEDGLVRSAPHLGWVDVPLMGLLQKSISVPIHVANDASLGALAERLFGAGRGVDHLIYLQGSAGGISGGLIVEGQPVFGKAGYAGEFGNIRPGLSDVGDRISATGRLDDEVRRDRLLHVLGVQDVEDAELEQHMRAAVAPDASAEIARQRRVLTAALAPSVDILDPEVIVLGGFLASILSVDPHLVNALLRSSTLVETGTGVRVVAAELGDNRLLVGAAELAFEPVLQDPAGNVELRSAND
jgi:predicted NBD/HSP70 family sugar kinase